MTFIDEQGGTGWTAGSHSNFRMTAVWLPTLQVEPFRESIRAVRTKLNIDQDREFKFATTHNRPEWREAFFTAAHQYDFRFTACAYDKNRMQPGSLEPAEFFWGCATTISAYLRNTYLLAEEEKGIAAAKPVLLYEQVVVDDNRDQNFLEAIQRAFRGLPSGWKPGAKLVKKVKFGNSAADEALQLADMVMGAIGAHLEGESDWYNVIADRDLGIVRLP